MISRRYPVVKYFLFSYHPAASFNINNFGEKLSFIPLGKNTLSKGLSFIRFWSCITQFLTLNYFLIPSWSDPYKKLHDKTTVNIVWKGVELARYPEWKMKSYHDSKKCKARSKSEKKHGNKQNAKFCVEKKILAQRNTIHQN